MLLFPHGSVSHLEVAGGVADASPSDVFAFLALRHELSAQAPWLRLNQARPSFLAAVYSLKKAINACWTG